MRSGKRSIVCIINEIIGIIPLANRRTCSFDNNTLFCIVVYRFHGRRRRFIRYMTTCVTIYGKTKVCVSQLKKAVSDRNCS
jgi:hypothetical protein